MNQSQPRQVQTVSQVTATIRQRLTAIPPLWVQGEITDVSRPSSGHIYFALKDQGAVLRAIMWRSDAQRLSVDLEDGMAVICRGDVDVYPPHGRYQLIAKTIELQGEGQLQVRLRNLQKKLAGEGLFHPRNKQPLPRIPKRIAIVTSPTGAALQDFLETAAARWPAHEALIVPTRVQGLGAATEIAESIRVVQRLDRNFDVLVLTRGGGSLEDLWCFNEEIVVRAIHHCSIPVVSAIGHEIDVTLSDLVADVRCVTPTAAAENVFPSRQELLAEVNQVGQTLQQRMLRRVESAQARLAAVADRRVLTHPREAINSAWRRVDQLEGRLLRAVQTRQRQWQQLVQGRAAQLESLSPLSVLSRGYSLTQKVSDDEVVVSANDLEVGDSIRSRFAEGEVISRVEEKS